MNTARLLATSPWILLWLCGSAPAADTLCKDSEEVLFSCPTSRERLLSVCAAGSVQGGKTLFYRFGTQSKLELQLSANAASVPAAVEGNQSSGARGYDNFIRFKEGVFAYTVRESWDGCPMPGQSRCPPDSSFAGVYVSKSGSRVARLRCQAPVTAIPWGALARYGVAPSDEWPE